MNNGPISRRVVALWTAVAVLGIVGIVGLTSWLRLDHPAAGPVIPEAVVDEDAADPLRDDISCLPLAGRDAESETIILEAQPLITSNELYDCPDTYDGRVVRYRGEVVGALLERRDGVWAQLNDDVYGDIGAPLPTHRDFRGGNAGIGVLLPAAAAADVSWIGGPGRHGDVLEVVGRFHRVDRETGEVAIIRADEVATVQEGRELDPGSAPARPVVASVIAALALAAVVVERRSREGR